MKFRIKRKKQLSVRRSGEIEKEISRLRETLTSLAESKNSVQADKETYEKLQKEIAIQVRPLLHKKWELEDALSKKNILSRLLRARQVKKQIEELKNSILLHRASVPRPRKTPAALENEIQYVTQRIGLLEKELEKTIRETTRQTRLEKLEAIAANAIGDARLLADRVRRKLENLQCPYCGGDLGESPHADHIYPLSKGGQSTLRNLVLVCADCNAKKRDSTLAEFIRKFHLDRDEIERRLATLGKDF